VLHQQRLILQMMPASSWAAAPTMEPCIAA
jgi:hypothetical protein